MLSDYVLSFSVVGSAMPLAVHTVQGAAHISPYRNGATNDGTVDATSTLITVISAIRLPSPGSRCRAFHRPV